MATRKNLRMLIIQKWKACQSLINLRNLQLGIVRDEDGENGIVRDEDAV